MRDVDGEDVVLAVTNPDLGLPKLWARFNTAFAKNDRETAVPLGRLILTVLLSHRRELDRAAALAQSLADLVDDAKSRRFVELVRLMKKEQDEK
jgi:hypothetical protein